MRERSSRFAIAPPRRPQSLTEAVRHPLAIVSYASAAVGLVVAPISTEIKLAIGVALGITMMLSIAYFLGGEGGASMAKEANAPDLAAETERPSTWLWSAVDLIGARFLAVARKSGEAWLGTLLEDGTTLAQQLPRSPQEMYSHLDEKIVSWRFDDGGLRLIGNACHLLMQPNRDGTWTGWSCDGSSEIFIGAIVDERKPRAGETWFALKGGKNMEYRRISAEANGRLLETWLFRHGQPIEGSWSLDDLGRLHLHSAGFSDTVEERWRPGTLLAGDNPNGKGRSFAVVRIRVEP